MSASQIEALVGSELRARLLHRFYLEAQPGLSAGGSLDLDVKYPRATPEKAFLNWLHLGQSNYSKIAVPPLDLEIGQSDSSRLNRLARLMGLVEELKAWRAQKRKHDSDTGATDNSSNDLEM